MPVINFDLSDLHLTLDLSCLHKPGVLRLDGYPLLVYAPKQWGQGIRTEDRGIMVSDIIVKLSEIPDYRKVATYFQTTEDHIRQAVQYAINLRHTGESS